MAPRMTKDEKELVLKLFADGMNTVQIGMIVNKSDSSIGLFLKKNGLSARHNQKFIPEEDKLSMCKMYNDKMSTIEIGKIFSLADATVAKILKEKGIKLRNSGTQSKISNHDYFSNIDTEDKAYFLGLLIADGCIIKPNRKNRSRQLRLTLMEEDSYMVEALERHLGGSNTVRHFVRSYKDNRISRQSEFSVASERIASDLAKFGVVERKSFITYLPIIENKLMPHLLRGIFDGNGTVYTLKKSGKIRFAIYGNELICNQINEFLHDTINLNVNKVTNQKKTHVSFVSYWSESDIIAFYKYIYTNANLFLVRKRTKFENYLFEHASTEIIKESNTSLTS